MQQKHRKLDSEANRSTSKLNKQQTEDYSTIDSTKCWRHQKEKSMQSKWQRIRKSCRRRRFCKRCKSCKNRKNQRRSSHMRKKQLKSQMQMQMWMQMQANKIWLSRNSRQNHKKYRIAKEDSLSISKMRTERWKQWKCEIEWITHWKRRKSI